MKSRWNDLEARKESNQFSHQAKDKVALRAYTSRLLGAEPSLVLHGGGNTSVKVKERNVFGEEEEILYVKGSGWDLATILPQGFSPVRLDVLKRLAGLEKLSDSEMVRVQKSAMTQPSAPGPSVETILHGIIPFQFVDHTHADAIVTLSNTPDGEKKLRELYGDKVLILPYKMPGFVLARQVAEATQDLDWSQIKGIILLHHGVFTFSDDARQSYEQMIELVNQAEEYIQAKGAWDIALSEGDEILSPSDQLKLSKLRKKVSEKFGQPVLAWLDQSPASRAFSSFSSVEDLATRGTVTPDHVIHTKPFPAILAERQPDDEISAFEQRYREYFDRNKKGDIKRLDTAPRWAVWKGRGTLAFGATAPRLQAVHDINSTTIKAIQWGEKLGGWKPLNQKDLFDCEYWELEQAKLKKGSGPQGEFVGRVAWVTGAARGIGKAIAEELLLRGACVVALDLDKEVEKNFERKNSLGIPCDVTDPSQVALALSKGIARFGGIDLLISNAGCFPSSQKIGEMEDEVWEKSLNVNLTSHMRLIRSVQPFLMQGFHPSILVIASKNVPAPGPGAGAYSVAKAGLTQLARIAALELGQHGIRVNVLHPNAVFDTGLWTDEVLASRAKSYGLSVEDYKRNNVLKVEVTSADVARMAAGLLGEDFARTTGAQIAIDGGNDRVI